jgi:hypothetical protein
MHHHKHGSSAAGRMARILASAALGAALTLTLGAAAARPAGPPARSAATTDLRFALNAVSALSATDAWAVGDSARVLHWNGTRWTQATIPGLPAIVSLGAVQALSATDVWAVGEAGPNQPYAPLKPLIVHWDGTAWTRVPSPGPTSLGVSLSSLDMDSATDGWATGAVFHYHTGITTGLEMHWNGTSWQQVPASPAFLFDGVKSFSPTDATAVGADRTGTHTYKPAAFHWNGTSWALTADLPPPPGVPAAQLFGADRLSTVSGADMWTLGGHYTSTKSENLAWHWDGTRWVVMALPSPGVPIIGVSGLTGVDAFSPADVWAVGYAATKNCAYNCIDQTVSVHWNGTRWIRVATPDPGGPGQSSILLGMGAAGPSDIWAVGRYYLSVAAIPHTLILHWNGTSWSQF